MSGIQKKYCLFGCDSSVVHGVPIHRFPNPEKRGELFSAWVSAVGENLSESDPKKIYNNKRICDHHFDPKFKTPAGRLIWSAVPTILNRIRQSVVTIVEIEHNYCRPRRESVQFTPLCDITNQPMSSGTLNAGNSENAQVAQIKIGAGEYQLMDTFVEVKNDYCRPRTESVQTAPLSDIIIQPSSNEICHAQVPGTKFDADKTSEFVQNQKIKRIKRKGLQMQNEIRRLRAKMLKLKARLKVAEKQAIKKDFKLLTKNMSDSAKLFTRMQFVEGQKKKKGRRFSLDEKILCLSLYKKSPKSYRLMCKHFTLPSMKLLKCLLSEIKLSPGINEKIFIQLKLTVEKMLQQDRLCTLVFDEMSIAPHIDYNVYTDDLVGFENYGNKKTQKFANHVLVFMVKGVKKNFKQPVAYYFTQSLPSAQLKNIIKDVVSKVQATGLKIIATVCDQSTINVSAINSLISEAKAAYFRAGKEWRKDIIYINKSEIIPLFDVPHLIKGIRNNLITKNMHYISENKEKTIKWEYFQQVYEADRSHGELRILPKLTQEHIDPSKIKKMRVKNAVQLLSYSMAVATDNLAARGDIPSECRDLIPFLLLVDKLFDSFNASSFSVPNGKIYRAAVKMYSPHHKLWQEALIMLKSVKFVSNKSDGETKSVPSVNNFIKTIEGFKEIWKVLSTKFSVDAMLTRNFNQDPLENFFGSIRSLGARNVAPNCVGFEGAFKTLLLNNFSSHHAINANCEEDSNKCLQSLKFFIKNKDKNSAPSQSQHIVIDQPLNVMQETRCISDSGADQRAYVCGWALTKCLHKVVKGCKICKNKLLGNANNQTNKYIRAKEYKNNKTWLCYPSDDLVACFKEIQNTTIAFLNDDCHEKNIKERIKTFLELFIDFDFLDCEQHKDDLKKHFTDTSINIIIYSWCRSVNRILEGKISYEGEDKIKKAALEYYMKHKTNIIRK